MNILLYDTYRTHGFARERVRFRGVHARSSVDYTVCRTTSPPVSVPFPSYRTYRSRRYANDTTTLHRAEEYCVELKT